MIGSLLVSTHLPREREAFRRGFAAAGYRMAQPGQRADLVAIWAGSPPVRLPECPVLVGENGYLGWPNYVALALGGHNGAGAWPAGDWTRWHALGIDLKPWRASGRHILVCPSRGMGWPKIMRQPRNWTESVVAQLRKVTDRPIKVRPHPGNWKMRKPKVPLAEDLKNAWACVIWGSTAGVHALIAGIPVIRCAPHWICAEAAGSEISEIERPPMPERRHALIRLASAQWSLDEIAGGFAIRRLLECKEAYPAC